MKNILNLFKKKHKTYQCKGIECGYVFTDTMFKQAIYDLKEKCPHCGLQNKDMIEGVLYYKEIKI